VARLEQIACKSGSPTDKERDSVKMVLIQGNRRFTPLLSHDAEFIKHADRREEEIHPAIVAVSLRTVDKIHNSRLGVVELRR
jgi:hypothetical protein